MAAYVAMEPPGGNAERTVLVRDGFTALAFLLPVFWFLFHRLWIEAALALAATLALGSLDTLGGLGGPLLTLLFSLLAGFEAPALRLWALRRRGWIERGVVEAGNSGDAEARFFLGGDGEAEGGAPSAPGAGSGRPRPGAVPVLGLLGGIA